MGQALTQMPQAIHLEAGLSGFRTMTFMGQASTQAPQLTHSFLLIMYTPVLGFWLMAPCSQERMHLPHWMQTLGLAALPLATMRMQLRSSSKSL